MSSAIDKLEGDNKQALGRFVVEYLEENPIKMGAVDGLATAVQSSTPAALPLATGWANYAGGFSPATYRVLPGPLVLLDGLVKKEAVSAFGDTIGALPSSTLFPVAQHVFITWGAFNGGAQVACRVDATSTGAVILQREAITTDFISLAGLLFCPGS